MFRKITTLVLAVTVCWGTSELHARGLGGGGGGGRGGGGGGASPGLAARSISRSTPRTRLAPVTGRPAQLPESGRQPSQLSSPAGQSTDHPARDSSTILTPRRRRWWSWSGRRTRRWWEWQWNDEALDAESADHHARTDQSPGESPRYTARTNQSSGESTCSIAWTSQSAGKSTRHVARDAAWQTHDASVFARPGRNHAAQPAGWWNESSEPAR